MNCRIGEEHEAGNPVNGSLDVCRGAGGLLFWCLPGDSSLQRLQSLLKVKKMTITNLHSEKQEAIVYPYHQHYRDLLDS